jgi:hypothetical protein
VRLGDGYDPSNVQKCTPFPSITSWSSWSYLLVLGL